MLRTTNKIVRERLASHVLEQFEERARDELGDNYLKNRNIHNEAMRLLREQMDAMRYGGRTLYQTGIDYAEGGSLLVYYGDQREFLREILEQTPEESNRYDDERVFRQYCHLIGRTMAGLYSEDLHRVTRDGEEKFRGSYAECREYLLKAQPQSTDWAIAHEGWDIKEVRKEEA